MTIKNIIYLEYFRHYEKKMAYTKKIIIYIY